VIGTNPLILITGAVAQEGKLLLHGRKSLIGGFAQTGVSRRLASVS
jgi:hypothetical protein